MVTCHTDKAKPFPAGMNLIFLSGCVLRFVVAQGGSTLRTTQEK